jgi:hypothetical protein
LYRSDTVGDDPLMLREVRREILCRHARIIRVSSAAASALLR